MHKLYSTRVMELELELLGRDGHLAQSGNHGSELGQRSDAFQDTHVRPSNFLVVSSGIIFPQLSHIYSP